MKTGLLSILFAFALTGAASATTYLVDVTADPFRVPGASGLQTRAVVLSPSGPQNFDGAEYAVELTNVGDSVTMDLYGLVQYDSPLNTDDLIHSPTSVTFDFGVFGIATIMGESFGLGTVLDPMATAFADFFGEIVIRIDATTAIIVTVADTYFGSADGVFTNGRPGFGAVTATFTLAYVPVPAAGLMLLAGLGALGALRRRKAVPMLAAA